MCTNTNRQRKIFIKLFTVFFSFKILIFQLHSSIFIIQRFSFCVLYDAHIIVPLIYATTAHIDVDVSMYMKIYKSRDHMSEEKNKKYRFSLKEFSFLFEKALEARELRLLF